MGEPQRLRVEDAHGIHRLINECRDLGADPIAWRKRMLEGLRRLIGAQQAVVAELLGRDMRRMRPVSIVDTGWDDPKQRAFFYEGQAKGAVQRHPVYQRTMRLPRNPLVVVRREMIVGDNEWYRSEHFNEFDRRCGCDAGIMSIHDLRVGESPRVDNITVRRGLGERKFNERERRIVECLHREVTPLIGCSLASVEEPSASELAPRVRETLECLLQGDSEKQAASRLDLSPETVHQYVKTIYSHFGVRSRGELLARWIRYGRGLASRRP